MGVKGLSVTINALRATEAKIIEEIKDVVADTTGDIERAAIDNAPGVGDKLLTTYGEELNQINIPASIDSKISPDGLTGEVYIDNTASKFAMYVEFGTGVWAKNYLPSLPAAAQAVARKYFVNGKSTLKGQPFLLPAFFKYRK